MSSTTTGAYGGYPSRKWQPKTNAKHWCTFCKTWIQNDAMSIKLHERGQRHQNNVKEYRKQQTDAKKQREHEEFETRKELENIEKAAQASMEKYAPAPPAATEEERNQKEGWSAVAGDAPAYMQDEPPPPPGPPPPDLVFKRQQQEAAAAAVAETKHPKEAYGWPWQNDFLPMIPPPPKLTRWGSAADGTSATQYEERSIDNVAYYCSIPYYPVSGEYKIKDHVTGSTMVFIEGPEAERLGFLTPGLIVEAAWTHLLDTSGQNTRDIWHAAVIRDVLRTEVPNTDVVITKFDVLFARYGTIGTVKSDDIRILLGRVEHVEQFRNAVPQATTEAVTANQEATVASESLAKTEEGPNESNVQTEGWTTVTVRELTNDEQSKEEAEKEKHLDLLNRYAAGEENVDAVADKDAEEKKEKSKTDANIEQDDGHEDASSAFNPFGGDTYRGFKLNEDSQDFRFTDSTKDSEEAQAVDSTASSDGETVTFKKRKVSVKANLRQKKRKKASFL
eukprot:gb/GECG01000368.1/.p1 GENE.gb/GECG01000368.1/~~gb/GECG01000368.1/.p1  ORF type:complete len:505 (+),score=91.06 gb/GECG01000368.1/:1-1515(+)